MLARRGDINSKADQSGEDISVEDRSKYAWDVYGDPWPLWKVSPSATFSFLQASRMVSVTSEDVISPAIR